MTKKDNLTKLPMKELKERLVLKTIKGRKYYYLKVPFGLSSGPHKTKKVMEAYVCSESSSDDVLRKNFEIASFKVLIEILITLYRFTKRHYRSTCISNGEIKLLEMLRFSYNVLLGTYSDTDVKRYENAIYTKYVYGTTSIEGNTYTLRETDLTLNEGLTVSGKENREFYEIENYTKMKKYIDSLSTIKIDIKLIKKIHSIIMSNIDDSCAGEFRKVDVGIRGSNFEPIPHVFVESELKKILKWYEKNEHKIHPVELAVIFHQKFEEIHPFKDGNGRVGREILRLMLKSFGFPTIFIDGKTREAYLKALDSGNERDHKPLCKFIVGNLIDFHNDLIENAKKTLQIAKEKNLEKYFKHKKIDGLLKKFLSM